MKHSTPRSQGASERTFPEATALSDESESLPADFPVDNGADEPAAELSLGLVDDFKVECVAERGGGGPNTCFFGIGTRPPL